jgi:hypothetical protein
VKCAVTRGLVAPEDLYLSKHRVRPSQAALLRAAEEVTGLMRVSEVLRGPAGYAAPDSLVNGVRALLDSQRLELLRP